jgi:hypothetical protein
MKESLDEMPPHKRTLASSLEIRPNISGVERISEADIKGIIQTSISKRSSTYYPVTEAEMDDYAQLGFLSSLFLTLFGLFAGFVGGCITALAQGTIPDPSKSILMGLSVGAGFVSVVFLCISIFYRVLQSKHKKRWKLTK